MRDAKPAEIIEGELPPPRGRGRPRKYIAGNGAENAPQPTSAPGRPIGAPILATARVPATAPAQAGLRRLRQSTSAVPLAAPVVPMPPRRFRQPTMR